MKYSYKNKRNINERLYHAIMSDISQRLKKILNENVDISENTPVTVYISNDDYAAKCYNDDSLYDFVEYLKDEDYFSYSIEEFKSTKDANLYLSGMSRAYDEYERAPVEDMVLRSDRDCDLLWIKVLDKYERGEITDDYDPYEDEELY